MHKIKLKIEYDFARTIFTNFPPNIIEWLWHYVNLGIQKCNNTKTITFDDSLFHEWILLATTYKLSVENSSNSCELSNSIPKKIESIYGQNKVTNYFCILTFTIFSSIIHFMKKNFFNTEIVEIPCSWIMNSRLLSILHSQICNDLVKLNRFSGKNETKFDKNFISEWSSWRLCLKLGSREDIFYCRQLFKNKIISR